MIFVIRETNAFDRRNEPGACHAQSRSSNCYEKPDRSFSRTRTLSVFLLSARTRAC